MYASIVSMVIGMFWKMMVYSYQAFTCSTIQIVLLCHVYHMEEASGAPVVEQQCQ